VDHQNWIGEAEGRKAEESDDDEKDFAESEGADAD